MFVQEPLPADHPFYELPNVFITPHSSASTPQLMGRALDTFVHALPHTYRSVDAPDGTLVALTITGDAGRRWFLLRERGAWRLYREVEQPPDVEVIIPPDVAWRLFTRGVSKEQAFAASTLRGDQRLGMTVLDPVAIIA